MRHTENKSLNAQYFDIIPEAQLITQMGLRKKNFDEMLKFVNEIKITRRKSFALGILLWKLEHGHSDEMFSVIFSVPRSTIERYITLVRIELNKHFVPLYLGEINFNRTNFSKIKLQFRNDFLLQMIRIHC